MSHGARMKESWRTYEWVMTHTYTTTSHSLPPRQHLVCPQRLWMSHGTRMNESWRKYEWVMAHTYTTTSHLLQADSSSPKLQIIFHKRATKCRSLSRKMTYKDKGSYESSPPCTPRLLTWCAGWQCRLCVQGLMNGSIYVYIYMYIYTYIYE